MSAVLATGSNRGIGLAFAQGYAKDGWRVFATCRSPSAAKELQALAAKSDGQVTVHALDVANFAAIDALAKELKREAIDVLIHNAGVYDPSPSFGSTDYDAWEHVFRVNTMAALRMAEAFVEQVARSDKKVIAGISSGMGSIADNGSGGYYAYRTSKSALQMVMRSLAIDLKPRGIKAVAMNPGWVKTDMGGPGGNLSPAESVKRMRAILDELGPNDSGKFWHHSGKEFPW
jgi:NAD(P)-dependent dehydrogenase (short-subunit alcohol dehydrogenase family)